MYKLQLVDELCRRVASYASEAPPEPTNEKFVNSTPRTSVASNMDLSKNNFLNPPCKLDTSKISNNSSPRESTIKKSNMSLSSVNDTKLQRGAFSLSRHMLGKPIQNKKIWSKRPSMCNDNESLLPISEKDIDFGDQEEDAENDIKDTSDENESRVEIIKNWILSLASYGPGFFNINNSPNYQNIKSIQKSNNNNNNGNFLKKTDFNSKREFQILKSNITSKGFGMLFNNSPTSHDFNDIHAAAFSYIAVQDAISNLKEIVALPPLYPTWARCLFSGVASAGCCGMFFGGGWFDVALSLCLGTIVAIFGKLAKRPFDKIFEFAAAACVAIITRLFIFAGIPLCYSSTTISSVIFLFQGITLTLSMVELATRNMVSGTTRLFYGLTITALIGFGLDLGATIPSLFLGISKFPPLTVEESLAIGTNEMPHVCTPIPTFFHYVFFVPTVTALHLGINAHWRQLPIMTVNAIVAFSISRSTVASIGPQLSSALAAFFAGSLANIYGRITGVPAIVPDLAGLMVLVPGAMAVRSVTALLGSNDPNIGAGLVVDVLFVALSLGIGLFMAGMVVVPFENWAEHLTGRHKKFDHAVKLEDLHF